MLNKQWLRFDFLKKKFYYRVSARYRPSLVFRLSLVWSKFTFSAGFQLFGLKTTSHGKPDLNIAFPGSDLRCGDVQGEVREQDHPMFQHLPVLRGHSTFWPENHFTG